MGGTAAKMSTKLSDYRDQLFKVRFKLETFNFTGNENIIDNLTCLVGVMSILKRLTEVFFVLFGLRVRRLTGKRNC